MDENVQQVAQIKGVSLKPEQSRWSQNSLAEARTVSLKPKSSCLSETLAVILAQASMLSPKREFVKKPMYFAILAQARPFLQNEVLYLTQGRFS